MKRPDLKAATALLIGTAALALVACDAQEARPTRLPPPTLDTSTVKTSVDTTAVPKPIIERLLDTVARASGAAREDIVIEQAQAATWGDTSMGCPQPNRDYLQRIVQGYWVVMHAGGQEYDYRIDQSGREQRCTGSTRQAPIVYPPDT